MRIDIQCLVGGTICDLNDFKLCVNSYNYETCAWTPNNVFGKPLLRNHCHPNAHARHCRPKSRQVWSSGLTTSNPEIQAIGSWARQV